MGLSVVFGIVKSHSGTIACYSEPAIGTTFKIYLPAILELPEESRADQSGNPIGGRETILLVDDEAPVRSLGEAILNRFG